MQQSSTKAATYEVLWKPCLSGRQEVGSELHTVKIHALMASASTQTFRESSYWALEGPRTSPQRPEITFSQPDRSCTPLPHVICHSAGPAQTFPSASRELLTCKSVFGWEARDFQGRASCKARAHGDTKRGCVSGFAGPSHCSLPLSQQSLQSKAAMQLNLNLLRGNKHLHMLHCPSATSELRLLLHSEKNSLGVFFSHCVSC